ncbi:MAG: cysteine peptidase family C39 domain-containing protein [Planctomycetaceae bacterium]
MVLLQAVVIGIASGGAAMTLQAEERAGSLSTSNLFCGPQAVQRVLREYGRDVPLFDLVRETQWPDYRQGSALSDLAAALEARGVQTCAVEVPLDTEIAWEHPVILHLSHSGQQHYVVWLPPEGFRGRPRIWDGTIPSPVKRRNPVAIRSSTVLLTSDQPIPRPPVVGRQRVPRRSANVMMILPALLGAVAAGYYLAPAFNRIWNRS